MPRSDHWYKGSVVYAVDVETFYDADGDGVGDLRGLTERIGYLSRLGVDCLWLLPFYPSPRRDNGYDVLDYYGVDDRLGTLGDFSTLLDAVESRGMRVIVDLVANHTSDQHPWFQVARRNPDSKYRDYYVWTDDPDATAYDADPIFPGQEDSVWTYDEVADAYYFHRFYDFEPGLNLANPDVRDEIRSIMGFWLRLGVDGFRVDAAPHMIAPKGLESTVPDDPHGILRNFRRFLTTKKGDAVLIGETDVEPQRLSEFFDDGYELQMLYNFLLNNYLFLALARESAEAVEEGMKRVPSPPPGGQWLNFLRNLDELDLEQLTESERGDVFEAFAPDDGMRIFGRGIRRRLAPMLVQFPASDGQSGGPSGERREFDGDRRRLRMAVSLLFSLPGTPMLVYGDEIGMGEDLSLSGRTAVRTPMQWSDEENAGFSTADPDDLVLPVVDDGPFGYERVNVVDQEFERDSQFEWTQRLVHVRKENPELGWGEFDLVTTAEPGVIVHQCRWEESGVIAVHNLADEATPVSFSLDEEPRLVDVFADSQYEPVEGDTCEFEIEPYGYRWLRVRTAMSSHSNGWEGFDV